MPVLVGRCHAGRSEASRGGNSPTPTTTARFLDALRSAPEKPEYGAQIPDAFRIAIYEEVIGHIERVSPPTPYAFCREARKVWDHFADDFGRHGRDRLLGQQKAPEDHPAGR